jgi:hypothetical protein
LNDGLFQTMDEAQAAIWAVGLVLQLGAMCYKAKGLGGRPHVGDAPGGDLAHAVAAVSSGGSGSSAAARATARATHRIWPGGYPTSSATSTTNRLCWCSSCFAAAGTLGGSPS